MFMRDSRLEAIAPGPVDVVVDLEVQLARERSREIKALLT
jgi:hypothetical protein